MSRLIATKRSMCRQRGSFLLEALIAVLIVALGILGLIGLEAKSIQNVDDNQFRAEAVFMANTLVGQMWTSNQATLAAQFDSTLAGPGTPYDEFKNFVQARLPQAAWTPAPLVVIAPRLPGTAVDATITVFWTPPGDLVNTFHQYQSTATVGFN
jgi:type IV pilus assembly protein PilV